VRNGSTGALTITGNSTVTSTNGSYTVYNASTGKITVSGTATVTYVGTTVIGYAIWLADSGTDTGVRLEIKDSAIVENNGNGGNAVNNASTGAITISGGEVKATGTGNAVNNASTGAVGGAVTITGGTVSVTEGYAVYNVSTGEVNISGGTVSATTGIAVGAAGKITVSEDALVTSANTNVESIGTIVVGIGGLEIKGGTVQNTANGGDAVDNGSTGTINISGGLVSTTSGGAAVFNYINGGTVNITGGTVSATTGWAVLNRSASKITVSGKDTVVTSRNTTANYGTIQLQAPTTDNTDVRLEISDGATVENTATNANARAVYNNSTGAVTISGGSTVSAITGVAVFNNSTGKITVSGADTKVTSENVTNGSGTIYLAAPTAPTADNTEVRLEIKNGTVENTANNTNGTAVYNNSIGAVTISGGKVSATTGRAVLNGSTGAVTISGGGTVSAITGVTVYNNSTGAVTISGGSTVSSGTGNAVLNWSSGLITVTGDATVTSENTVAITGTNPYPGTIYLRTGTDVLLEIKGGTVENTADNGNTVFINSAGAVNISGGTVKATTGIAVYKYTYGLLTVEGTAKVTSENPNTTSGTICLRNLMAAGVRLTIKGGTVENTAAGGFAVYNDNTYTNYVTITAPAVIIGEKHNCPAYTNP
jgi:hypothetical protein